MGYMRHHAIIVTAWDKEAALLAHKKACELFPQTTELLAEAINGIRSFMIPPDGSKEGWAESEDGDKARNEFIEWLNDTRCDDGSSSFDWVEVQFGDDNRQTIVTRHSDEPHYYEGRR